MLYFQVVQLFEGRGDGLSRSWILCLGVLEVIMLYQVGVPPYVRVTCLVPSSVCYLSSVSSAHIFFHLLYPNFHVLTFSSC